MSFDPPRIEDGFLFTWNIENINVLSEAKITSPIFITLNLENSEWNMELFRRRLHLTRINSKRKMDVSDIEVDLSAVSSNGSNSLFSDTKYNKGFQWDLPGTLFDCKTLTIHCHMRKPSERNVSVIEFSALTVIQAERRVGIWKVENFKLLSKYAPINYALESAGKQLPSIVLSGEKCDMSPKRKIILQFLEEKRQTCDFKESDGKQLPSIMQSGEDFKIKVSVPDFSRHKMIFLFCEISCLTEDGKVKCFASRTYFFKYLSLFSTSDRYYFHPDMNSDIEFTVNDIDLTNGGLSLICDFIISNGEYRNELRESNYLPNKYKFVTNSQVSNSSIKEENTHNLSVPNIPKEGTLKSEHDLKSCQKFQKPTETLEDDLNYEYLDKKYCDVVMSTGNKLFPVHKCILCLKSPVFKTMFETDTRETSNKKVHIDDLDSDTLRRFLLFLYTDNLGNLKWETAAKLYYAADKYQVTSLKSECSSFLKSHLSMSSVCEALRLADLHQDEDLKLACNDFILRQDAAKLFSSEGWKAFTVSNPALSAEILQKYFLLKN